MDNSTPDMSEKLVLYLDGELSGSEKNTLEQQLAADKTLQGELESLQSTREAVKFYGLKQKVASIHGQMMEELQAPVKEISSVRRMVRYSVAIAASLLLLVGGYWAYNFFTLSPDKVFASNYRSYELVTVRDGGNNETSAEKAYKEKNYKEVIRIHDAGEDHTPKGEFLCGVSALELGDNSKAITCFKEVLDTNKQSLKALLTDETEYYLSLGYIRNKDYDFAIGLLNKIQNDPNHIYNEKVSNKLIRQVKMLKWR
jgi:tetratricopeptide (TPR) repeat protein